VVAVLVGAEPAGTGHGAALVLVVATDLMGQLVAEVVARRGWVAAVAGRCRQDFVVEDSG
jgi:short subunit dehydrogenase-like uncharacterized protein